MLNINGVKVLFISPHTGNMGFGYGQALSRFLNSAGYDLVQIAKAGLSTPTENLMISDTFLKLKSMTAEEPLWMAKNGRMYALEKHHYSEVSHKIAEVFS